MSRRHLTALAAALALTLALTTGCQGSDTDGSGDRLKVAAAFYPLEYLARTIGGDDVELTTLTKPGAEPHDIELSAQQTAAVADADLVLYLDGFQPAVDEAVEQHADDTALDLGTDSGDDPHLWLDPVAYAAAAEAVGDELAERAPEHADEIEQRVTKLSDDLRALDDELRAGLADCRRTEIVTSHAAFGHLAKAYGLKQVAITGLTPDEEPAPGRLAQVADIARAQGVTTIFFEELVSPRTARALAAEVGAKTAVLSPIEGPPDEGDYFTAMRTNLQALRLALDCT